MGPARNHASLPADIERPPGYAPCSIDVVSTAPVPSSAPQLRRALQVLEVRAGEERLSASGPADHQILIREYAGWDHNCEAAAQPGVHLDEPPRHGNVCAEIGNIKIRSMYYGTQSQCIGRDVRGVRVIYRPYPGYSGADGIRYSEQYPSDRRPVSVTVTLMPEQQAARRALPSSVAAPAPDAQQLPGPVPACAEFVS
jgi:hypothetical protein